MDIIEVKEVWNQVKDDLEVNLPEHVFGTWITPLEAVDCENNTLVLISPHPMAIDILRKSWTDKIKESETIKEESEERLNTIESSMSIIEREIDSILSASEENAKLIGEKILQDGQKTALVVKENTEKALQNSYALLKNDLLKKASLASVEVAKNHIIEELRKNTELHDKLIEESIEAIEKANTGVN
jgi:F0F1-type ATP synthase membrane subunit b/b'